MFSERPSFFLITAVLGVAFAWTAGPLSPGRLVRGTTQSPLSRSRSLPQHYLASQGDPFSLSNSKSGLEETSSQIHLSNSIANISFQPIFDFRNESTIDRLERLDDAIMGGISTSSVRGGDGFARWMGVCRTDGGGFCGFRTNPFTKPLLPGSAEGFYVVLRLASDADVDRRVWKFSTRVRPDRGELLYQAPVKFEQPATDQWSLVKVPFDSFRLVRGPKFVDDGPLLNVTGGLYQIGMTMSKFEFGGDLKAIDNFRDGFFELQIREIGLYQGQDTESFMDVSYPEVMLKEEAKMKRPILLKVLRPVSRIFFSEQR